MRTTAQRWSAAFVWLGIGTLVGACAGGAAPWIGVGLLCAGVLLNLVPGSGAAVPGAPEAAGTRSADAPPGLEHLGTRVEQILRLAEEQAHSHRTEVLRKALQEAQEIVSAAQVEAARTRGEHP